MVAYWLWTSRKVGSHSTGSKHVKNLVFIFLALNELRYLKFRLWTSPKLNSHFDFNNWAWLLLRCIIEPFLSVKTCPSKFFLVHAYILGVAVLKYIFWGSNFTHILNIFLSLHSNPMVASGCSYVFGKIAASDRKNKNAQSIFTIFYVVFTLLI